MKKILVTGAAGGIGTRLRKLLKGVYPTSAGAISASRPILARTRNSSPPISPSWRRSRRSSPASTASCISAAFRSKARGRRSCKANIVGCYNLFEAAYRAGVKRVVFASSNHAVGFYPREKKDRRRRHRAPGLAATASARPSAKRSARFYADKHGLRVTCIRIGNVGDAPLDKRRLSIWLKPEDLVQLIRIGLEHADIHFEIFYGASDNAAAWWDNSNARRFGYKPQGKAEEFRAEAMAAQAKLAARSGRRPLPGRTFCSDEYDADSKR